jgi:peptidyl-dipeptidase A
MGRKCTPWPPREPIAPMLHRTPILLAAVVLLISVEYSCMKKTDQQVEKKMTVKSKNELYVYLDTLEQRYEKACERMGLANWNSYSGEAPYDLDGAKAEFAGIFGDTVARSIIETWLKRASSLSDKPLARRLELWHRCFIGGAIYADPGIAAIENRLQQTITGFKLKFGDSLLTRAEVSNRLRQERKQQQRHRLWSLTSQISASAGEDLIRLVKLRNERARSLGFSNYYSLALRLQAIDEAWLLKTMNELEEQTRAPLEAFIAAAREKMHAAKFEAWDYDYALREGVQLPDKYFLPESVFEIIHEFQKSIGFDVDSLPIREVVKDIPYGGLSLAIRIPSDSRFLVNPTKGKNFYSVAFHEYGHSLKAVHTRVEYPILKGYEWIPGAQCAAYEEGVADMHGEFTDDSLWISAYTEVKPKQIERYIKNRPLPALCRLRRLMKDFFLEYSMYRNPDQDLPALEKEMFKKYLLVDLDDAEPHQFAASIWYVSYPCYYQNYVLAGMIATQLQEALTSKFGEEKSQNPHLAEWMIAHLYATGESDEWTERIRDATGKSLESGPYLRKLGIDVTRNITKD